MSAGNFGNASNNIIGIIKPLKAKSLVDLSVFGQRISKTKLRKIKLE